jgi:uncharacterized membrane protein
MWIFALLGIIGSLKLSLFTAGTAGYLGPAFTPVLYSLVLFICGIVLFVSDKSGKKLNIRTWILEEAHRKAFAFFLLSILLLILFYIFGPFIAVLAFCILSCLTLKSQTLRGVIIFSIVFTIVFYVGFIVLLKVQFDSGIIFELWRYR